MSTADQSDINHLNFVTRELNRYIPIIFLTLGTVGNILNILVFSRPSLRTNPCSIYFISSSVINFFSLYVGLITPFLALYNLDPTQTSDVLCKLRYYLRYSSISLSTWFILCACLDRYLSSSSNANVRSWSSSRVAKRVVCTATIVCFALPFTNIFYCYGVKKNTCTYQNNVCKLANDMILIFCNSGVPPILMVLSSALTIRNVKYSNRTAAGRRRDTQLTKILLIQVSILVSFAIPVTVQKIYSSATMYATKSALTMAIESLTNQVSIEISYVSNSTTFYIYSFTNKKYRQEVLYILASLFRSRTANRNAVQPLSRDNLNETMVNNATITRNRNEGLITSKGKN